MLKAHPIQSPPYTMLRTRLIPTRWCMCRWDLLIKSVARLPRTLITSGAGSRQRRPISFQFGYRTRHWEATRSSSTAWTPSSYLTNSSLLRRRFGDIVLLFCFRSTWLHCATYLLCSPSVTNTPPCYDCSDSLYCFLYTRTCKSCKQWKNVYEWLSYLNENMSSRRLESKICKTST